MAGEAAENYSEPILEGTAPSDYERYLNTEELLRLQKGPDEWVHRDELLFQVTHQSSELWLKLCSTETREAVAAVRAGDVAAALRLLRRAVLCLRFITAQLDMLEHMSPWEYQEIRRVLGHGSGFDSPGFAELRRVLPRLGDAFHERREQAGLEVVDVYVQTWRIRQYRVVARVIGDAVIGTQGTPVEVLGRLIHKVHFPELWQVRNDLTALSKQTS
jgi:tryptophan 2,3-dioxygenase